MLKLILGRAGSGKTWYAVNTAVSCAQSGRDCILLVPEQFTFEAEKTLLKTYGAKSCLHITVLSFSRLAHRVFSQYGGLAVRYIDECGRYIMMSRAIKQVSDMLGIYGRQAGSTSFAKAMAEAAAEYKSCGISPDMLTQAAKKSGGLLKQKLSDIALITQAYDALLQNGRADPMDDLKRLSQKLSENPFFKGKTVIADGFKGFTAVEREVLGRIMAQADKVYVTLCAENTAEKNGLFAPVSKTARQLEIVARKNSCRVMKPEVIGGTHRFVFPELAALEAGIFRPGAGAFSGEVKAIRITSAANPYDEIRTVASQIRQLVRETGCRYSDIAVISRSLEQYGGSAETVFRKYDIPFFLDSRRSIEFHPLSALILSLLDMAASGARPELAMRYLKTGLAGFTVEEAASLENYIKVWNLNGSAWGETWTQNPEGFLPPDEKTKARLERLNALREKFYRPVELFRQKLNEARGTLEIASAVYEFLCENGVRDAVDDQYQKLMADGETVLAEEYGRIWGKFMQILDQTVLTLGDSRVSPAEFAKLMHLVTANTDLGQIPPTQDGVVIGDAQRIRTGGTRYAFVIGLAESLFPRKTGVGLLLSEREREVLNGMGLELPGVSVETAQEERFFAYMAFTCASHGLFLSYPRSDGRGHAYRSSYFTSAVRKLLPGCAVNDDAGTDTLETAQNDDTAFELLSRVFNDGTPLTGALKAYFSAKPGYEGRIDALTAASLGIRQRFDNRRTALKLYGGSVAITPSRVETFRQCRFMYFCRYGLKAKTRQPAELNAPQIGTVIHFVLEKLLSGLNGRTLDAIPRDELFAMTAGYLSEFADGYLGGLEDKPERFKFLYKNLSDSVMSLIERMAEEFAQSGFMPVDFELPVGRGGGVEPLTIQLDSGGSLTVSGTVDRVDIMKKGGTVFLRVVDYKTGSKTFNLEDIVYGLNLQMLIYLFTLRENGSERYGTDQIVPAGILYMPAKRPDISADRMEDKDKIKREAMQKLKMSGLIVSDAEIILGMEKSGEGKFIPAAVKAETDGETVRHTVTPRSSTATLAQFGIMEKQIKRILKDMAETLRGGDVSAIPVNGLGYDPCAYCEYRPVCGFDKGCETRKLEHMDSTEIWKMLEGAENE